MEHLYSESQIYANPLEYEEREQVHTKGKRVTRHCQALHYGYHYCIGRPLVSIITTYLEIRDLEKEKAIYVEQIQRDSLLINNLKSDEFLERYAREKYNMQRKNEEVFIVE